MEENVTKENIETYKTKDYKFAISGGKVISKKLAIEGLECGARIIAVKR